MNTTPTDIHPADLLPTYLFENATYDTITAGDRVRVARMYHGEFIDWDWRILTVDRVDWINRTPGRQALMLHFTHPSISPDWQFWLICGAVEAGVQRVIGVEPPRCTLHEVRLVDGEGYTVPGAVETVPADQVDAVSARLLAVNAAANAAQWGDLCTFGYRVQVTPLDADGMATRPAA